MVILSQPPDLSGLQIFHTTDPLLSNGHVLVFYGPSSTSNSQPATSSRIQCHVLTAAGFQSYPRLIVSPASPLYSAVNCLPREDQGDEICRALAFALLKYFTELSETAKSAWTQQSLSSATRPPAALNLWGDTHAADLAHRMAPIDDPTTVISQVESAFSLQSVSHLDIDLVLPPDTLPRPLQDNSASGSDDSNDEHLSNRYGEFGPLVKLFGDTVFLPTSKIRRAPSKPAALNRTATFTRSQKDNMRREMREFVETESRYVEKLSDLVNSVAASFRSKAQQKPFTSFSPDEKALETLFPPSLNTMLSVNTQFLMSLRGVVDATERAATADIEATCDSSVPLHPQGLTSAIDPTGAAAFANLLVEWFPKFADCYTDYIQKHSKFGPFLKSLAGAQSSFATRVQETGEQRLTSMLIEPVQRLPRYSLYVDNLIKQLPIRHPALKNFLRAKDIISDICSQDGSSSSLSKIPRIKQIIPSWPATFSPQGRFILAVDVAELNPPYQMELSSSGSNELILLLFAGYLVFLKKLGDSPMSARSLMVEIEGLDNLPTSPQEAKSDNGLLFSHYMPLRDLSFHESGSDRLIKLVPSKPRQSGPIRSPHDSMIRLFLLKGVFEGRASRWTKEIVRARVEGRFSESERESSSWEARSVDGDSNGLGLFTAVFEDGPSQYTNVRGEPGAVRVVMNPSRDSKVFKAGQSGVDIVASVSPKGQGFFWLEIEAVNEKGTRDLTTELDFLPILTKRLGNLLQMRNQMRNPVLAVYLLQHHGAVLNSLSLAVETPTNGNSESPAKRAASPVKMLSNLFGSRSFKEPSGIKGDKILSPVLTKPPSFFPPPRSNTSSVSSQTQKDNVPTSLVTLFDDKTQKPSTDPFQTLEQTLSCYLLALQARKGNIIGSVVARRSVADQAAVNELYNTLLENPENHERAAQASVDLLFAAFEQFLKVAWKEKLGPIIPSPVLSDLQTNVEILNPFDYDEYAEKKFEELAPQNRRAFSNVVSLLAHLLDGMRNDGDRGTLTASFAEIVVCDGDPYSYIPLFDKFVEDHDVLSPDRPISQGASSGFASVASSITRSTKTGSISSKASSLSKRLGFGSTRKAESPLKADTKKPLPPEPSPEKLGFVRSKSTDITNQLTALRRPGSRDRPAAFGASESSRPGTSHSNESPHAAFSSRENSPAKRNGTLKKKRRSSLSDLTTLQTPSASPFWTTSATKQIEGILQPSPHARTPLNGLAVETPSRAISARQVPLSKKENAVPGSQLPANSENVNRTGKESEITPLRIRKVDQTNAASQSTAQSNDQSIQGSAVSKGILVERVSSGNHPAPLNLSPKKNTENSLPTKQSIDTSPKKLRMQSPTKLRERLQTHQQAVESANTTLEAEMAKIGQEIAALNARPPPPPAKNDAPPAPPKNDTPAAAFNLNTRLKALETKVTHLTTNLSDRSAALEKDLASSLHIAETRAKKLDSALQHANAENEALYARMNDETMKVFEQVRTENGVEELRKQLRESHAEAAKWRKDAARLKRENVGLRAQLGGA